MCLIANEILFASRLIWSVQLKLIVSQIMQAKIQPKSSKWSQSHMDFQKSWARWFTLSFTSGFNTTNKKTPGRKIYTCKTLKPGKHQRAAMGKLVEGAQNSKFQVWVFNFLNARTQKLNNNWLQTEKLIYDFLIQ